jgi:hypothetical protein
LVLLSALRADALFKKQPANAAADQKPAAAVIAALADLRAGKMDQDGIYLHLGGTQVKPGCGRS